jgi:hypothetical protein
MSRLYICATAENSKRRLLLEKKHKHSSSWKVNNMNKFPRKQRTCSCRNAPRNTVEKEREQRRQLTADEMRGTSCARNTISRSRLILISRQSSLSVQCSRPTDVFMGWIRLWICQDLTDSKIDPSSAVDLTVSTKVFIEKSLS